MAETEAEALDLEEWEVLSRNSSVKAEEEEEEEDDDDDGFTYFEYLDNDPGKRRGELCDPGELGRADCGGVGGGFGAGLGELSGDSDPEMVAGTDGKGFGGYGADLGTDDPTEEFVAGVVTCDGQDSVGELGFGEMEVLNEFCLNQGGDGVGNCDKSWLTTTRGSDSEDVNDSAFPFQGIDGSDSVLASEPISGAVDWRSPEATDGFFEMRMGFQSKVSSGDCSSGREEQDIPRDEHALNGSDVAEVGGEVRDGAKGEKAVVLSWLKVPIEMIKYCIFGVRPVWSISMAMGFLGFLMFSRSYYLYRKSQKDGKTRPALKVRFDEKKGAAIQTRAARLNKAVGLVRQDPILRTPFPAFGVTLFPVMSSFQWAP